MGAEIDRLEVQVEAQATKANNQLDTLATKLDKVSGALSRMNSGGLTGLSNGVAKFAQASAQLSNVKTADFTRLAKNVEKLSSLNTQQIYGAASAMTSISKAMNNLGSVSSNSMQVAQVAKDIAKLGGANVEKAITNMPQLASALKNLMQTLSTAPQVSQNIIDMTASLANLASQGSKVASATNTLQGNGGKIKNVFSAIYQPLKKVSDRITIFGNNVQKANKKAKSFSSTIGSLYQKFYYLRQGVSALWDSIESSMNYLEVLNYFDAAFGQVADNAVGQWEEAGYSSAEAYYNSFSERAKELTAKMSGYTIGDNGILESTGAASLGINPSKLMNYQAMFAQMSNSMGVASETSLLLSQALTEIGADLASVKNMDFDKVWTDMASGLAGMSRTLDKYGVNIRNVNLQEKLHELGINANIQALNQNEKALLRTIILLDSTRYAWGDLADTLNMPANQIRLLSANFENLARTIGSIFLPIVSKVLPYINGLVIALQRLFGWIAKLMGVDLSGLTSSVGSGGDGIGDLLGDVDDLGTSLDDATGSAKKLKQQLQGFDALNVISSPQDSDMADLGGGGIGGLLDDAFLDAFSEYQKAWDEAFANVENRAEEIADSIEKIAKKLFTPIKKAWDKQGAYVMAAWKKALKEIGTLVSDIGRDMMTVWQQDATVDILSDVFHIIGDIGLAIGLVAERFDEAWNSGSTGLHILENIRDIIGVVIGNIRNAADATVVWASELDFEPILDKIEEWTASLVPVFDSLSGTLTDFYEQVLLPLGKWVLEEGLPDLLQVFIDFNNKVDWEALRTRLSEFWDKLEPFAETVGEGLIEFIDRVAVSLADFINSQEFSDFLDKIGEWMDNVTTEDVADTLENIATALVTLKLAVTGFSAISAVTGVLTTVKSFLSFFGIGGAGATVAKGLTDTATAVTTLSGALDGLATAGALLAGLYLGEDAKNMIDKERPEDENQAQWKAIQEEYDGMTGSVKLLADSFEGLNLSMEGLPLATANAVQAHVALEKAMEAVNSGTIYTDEQMQKMQKTWELTDEDMEMLRQSMLDMNPELREVADNFGLFDASVETLEDISYGMGLIKDGAISATEAFDEFSKPMWGMNEDALAFFETLRNGEADMKNFGDNMKSVGENITNGLTEGMTSVKMSEPSNVLYKNITAAVCDSFGIHSPAENMKPLGEYILLGIVEGFRNKFEAFTLTITEFWDTCVTPWFTLEKWAELWNNVQVAFSEAWNSLVTWWNESAVGKWFVENVEPWFTKEKWVSAISGIEDAFGEVWANAISAAKGVWNEFATWLNGMLEFEIEGFTNPFTGESFGGMTVTLGRIPTFQTGGFPEDGLFMANHSELVGRFSNGKTAVANNEQIVAGIASGVRDANAEQNALLREQNQLLRAILEKEGITADDIFRSVQNSAESYYKMTGNRAFVT